MSNKKWLEDSIQFPRLLAEMAAVVDFTPEQRLALMESMDLAWEEIDDILERAVIEFDYIKAEL